MRRLAARLSFLVPVILGLGAATVVTAVQAQAATGTVVSTHETPFGLALVAGSGPDKGFSLYDLTSDNAPSSYGCTTVVLHIGGQTGTCTGPENDKNAIWPALTTTGAPVAGPGVSAALLGTVHRSGVGTQVTYAGHPLYLFDQAPGQVTGEGFEDPAAPLPHGSWFLVKPDGLQLPWTPTITTVTLSGHPYVAVLMETLAGWIRFPAYTRAASCTGACERVWPYVLSEGFPGTEGGAHEASIGLISTSYGQQVTYDGQPLYLFGPSIANLSTDLISGNGNGVGGFALVSP